MRKHGNAIQNYYGQLNIQNPVGLDAVGLPSYQQQSGQGFVLNATGASTADVRGVNITNSTSGATAGTYGLIVNNSGINALTVGKTSPGWSGSKWTNAPTGEISWVMSGGAIPMVFGVNGVQYLGIAGTGNVTVNAPTAGIALTVNGLSASTAAVSVSTGGSNRGIQILPSVSNSVSLDIIDPGTNNTELRLETTNSLARVIALGTSTGITLESGSGVSVTTPSVAGSAALTVNGLAGTNLAAINVVSPNTAGQSSGVFIQAGTNGSDTALNITNAAVTHSLLTVFGDGGVTVGSPTGGDPGLGIVNATGYQINGVSISAGTIQSAHKASSTTRTSTTTLSNDPDLSITVVAGTYDVELFILPQTASAGASGGFVGKIGGTASITGTSSTQLVTGNVNNAAVTAINGTAGTTQFLYATLSASAAAFPDVVWVKATVTCGSGTLTLSWAQNTSQASGTLVDAGSFIKVTKLT